MNLSGLTKKKGSSESKTYPTLPDPDGKVAKSVGILCDLKGKIDQLKGTYEAHESQVKSLAKQFAWRQREKPGTVKAFNASGAAISLSMANRYCGIDTTVEGVNGEDIRNPRIENLRKIMGDNFDSCMEPEVSVSVDITKFDPAVRQAVIYELVSISEMYNSPEGGIVARERLRPKPSFHLERCEKFSEAENARIDRELPMSVSLRAKGVK